ncbi:TetR/AcrR family transcriptional regulator [Actinomadura sp. K4S16]|uniref:TetR/AcrR family transcriptional regulator n=1 Tax=Actinomadura sp. K4S16 TaxID=1316147 RepID=UPI00190FAD7D|nr:TetR/AcrR family transcriptional regulator [Actinomadura sp. K4S16]
MSKASLLAAAAEEFAQYGLRGARVQAIVKRAGVNERMIYHHFGSKEGLYRAVLEDQMAALHDAWHPALEKARALAPYEGVTAALGALAEALSGRPVLIGLWLHESLGGWKTLPLPSADTLPAELRELYERGQHEGVFRGDRPFEIAWGIAMSALIGGVVLARRGDALAAERGIDFTAAETRRLVLEQLLDGMTGSRRSPGEK